MMTVSTNEYVLYTLYEMTISSIFILFLKGLIVRWAQDIYMFSENQVAGTVELVTDSTFDHLVGQVSIQGFPRQIPDGDPNRYPSLVVPGPHFPGTGEDKQPSLCILLTLDTQINLYVSDVHTFTSVAITNSFIQRVCL